VGLNADDLKGSMESFNAAGAPPALREAIVEEFESAAGR
jgi:hypothetical protein